MKQTVGITWGKIGRLSVLASAAITLAGCEDGKTFNLFKPKAQEEGVTEVSQKPGKTVERDVEAPDLFYKAESGLWDGRPSLGGVWVAHPDVTDPLRVKIHNEANGKTIVGALFRRERENPGPRIQVSSDAASKLKMLAGQPVKLDIVALRREKIEEPAPEPETVSAKETLDAPEAIEEKPLDPIASAAAAIDAAEGKPVARPATPSPKPAAAPAVAPSKLAKPYIQLGTFGRKENADKVIEDMRKEGLFAIAKEQTSGGKTVWRVLVGPAGRRAERTAMLRKVKSMGFKDAYTVSN